MWSSGVHTTMSSPTVNQKYTSLLIDDKTHLTKSTFNHLQEVSTDKSTTNQQSFSLQLIHNFKYKNKHKHLQIQANIMTTNTKTSNWVINITAPMLFAIITTIPDNHNKEDITENTHSSALITGELLTRINDPKVNPNDILKELLDYYEISYTKVTQRAYLVYRLFKALHETFEFLRKKYTDIHIVKDGKRNSCQATIIVQEEIVDDTTFDHIVAELDAMKTPEKEDAPPDTQAERIRLSLNSLSVDEKSDDEKELDDDLSFEPTKIAVIKNILKDMGEQIQNLKAETTYLRVTVEFLEEQQTENNDEFNDIHDEQDNINRKMDNIDLTHEDVKRLLVSFRKDLDNVQKTIASHHLRTRFSRGGSTSVDPASFATTPTATTAPTGISTTTTGASSTPATLGIGISGSTTTGTGGPAAISTTPGISSTPPTTPSVTIAATTPVTPPHILNPMKAKPLYYKQHNIKTLENIPSVITFIDSTYLKEKANIPVLNSKLDIILLYNAMWTHGSKHNLHLRHLDHIYEDMPPSALFVYDQSQPDYDSHYINQGNALYNKMIQGMKTIHAFKDDISIQSIIYGSTTNGLRYCSTYSI